MKFSSLDSADRELAHHLETGRGPLSAIGRAHARDLSLGAMRNPGILRLCRVYGISQMELADLLVEIIASQADPFVEGVHRLAVTELLTDPSKLEPFLRETHAAAHGLVSIHRRSALRVCAKRQAAKMDAARPVVRPPALRGRNLKLSIQSKLPILLVCALAVIAGIILAIYFL